MVKILRRAKDTILKDLRSGNVTVCIVGLGYVGLPLSALFASEGARVIGCDVREEVVEKVSRGKSPIQEHDVIELLQSNAKPLQAVCPACAVQLFDTGEEVFCPHCQKIAEIQGQTVRLLSRNVKREDLAANRPRQLENLLKEAVKKDLLTVTSNTTRAVKEADAVLITVGTPIDNSKKPDTKALSSACTQIGRGLTEDTLVILKSTVSPGTTQHFVAPILARESGLTLGNGFGLAHMPERIKEGMALYEFRTLPRIVAGIDRRSAEAAAALFSIFPAPIHVFDSPEITEASKLFENIYRDVNIALANELALICEALGIDVMKIIEAAHTDPKTHFLTPGPGVGGYCLPKDPYYLTQPAAKNGFNPSLIPMARMVNEDMPHHVARLIEEVHTEAGLKVSESTITVLGLAFKGNSGDLRNTPILPIVKTIQEKGARVIAYDPLVDPEEAKILFSETKLAQSLNEAVKDAHCIVIAADHIELRKLTIQDLLEKTKNLKAIVDARHVFNPEEVIGAGLAYRGLGHGRHSRV